ncbi:MAG TPA: GntR family transcriptional regulator, partial [Longimicrobiaceae bacterium]|nr:GntR family transcriptional regulator [Longimicrobiaceae bacterium]
DAAGARPAGPALPARRWRPDEMRRVLVGHGRGEFVDRLRAGIAAGTTLGYLRPGDRLPSIREAAQAAGVDHRVVASAYRWLAAEGTVEVRNRHGVMVAAPPAPDLPELGETAEWLARVLEEACAHQVKVSQLPDLLRRWTASARLHCACVESCPDSLAALTHELKHQWGLDTYPVALARGTTPGHPGEGLAEALRGADLVVTTPFHAATIRAAAGALGKPLVVVHASEEMVAAVEEALRAGPLTAVVADAEYGERLRAVAGGERLRVVLADDGEAVAALDPAQPVLLTRAAQQRTAARLRLLVPVSPSLSPAAAGEIARVMVARNLAAERALAV